MSLRSRLLAALFVTALSPMAAAAVFTVGPVGTPGACTHTTVQAAVNAAAASPGADEIRIAIAGTGYTDQAIVVNRQDLALRGGYADCAVTARSGLTRLSGTGGLAAAVLRIFSYAKEPLNVQLEGLELVDGDNSTQNGGGLHIEMSGAVRISQCRFANNLALSGGGIAVQGFGLARSSVTIGDGVQIEDNRAPTGSGGGIDVYGAHLTLGGIDTVVRRNRARTGGGIALHGDAGVTSPMLDLQSGGEGGDGIVSRNLATNLGGGLSLTQGAVARLYTTDPSRPLRLDHNVARAGGAIAALSAGDRVSIREGLVEFNQATEAGGAFLLFPATTLRLSGSDAADAPASSVVCAAATPCNRVVGNRSASSSQWEGAVLSVFVGGNPSPATAHFESTVFTGNAGRALFADWCDDTSCAVPSAIKLRNSLIVSNPDAPSVVANASASGFECDLSTIRASGAAGSAALFDSNGPLTLTRSIVHEPGRDVIGGRTPQSLNVAHLLVHDASDFGANATVLVADPRFVDPNSGDYRLAADSPAVDFAPQAADAGFAWTTPPFDLDRKPRVFDQPAIVDIGGAVDLGAYERPDPNMIFADGFE